MSETLYDFSGLHDVPKDLKRKWDQVAYWRLTERRSSKDEHTLGSVQAEPTEWQELIATYLTPTREGEETITYERSVEALQAWARDQVERSMPGERSMKCRLIGWAAKGNSYVTSWSFTCTSLGWEEEESGQTGLMSVLPGLRVANEFDPTRPQTSMEDVGTHVMARSMVVVGDAWARFGQVVMVQCQQLAALHGEQIKRGEVTIKELRGMVDSLVAGVIELRNSQLDEKEAQLQSNATAQTNATVQQVVRQVGDAFQLHFAASTGLPKEVIASIGDNRKLLDLLKNPKVLEALRDPAMVDELVAALEATTTPQAAA